MHIDIHTCTELDPIFGVFLILKSRILIYAQILGKKLQATEDEENMSENYIPLNLLKNNSCALKY